MYCFMWYVESMSREEIIMMKCEINGIPVKVGITPVWTPPYNGFSKNCFVICSLEEETRVVIDFGKEVRKAVVRPLSSDVCCETEGSKVSLALTKACNLSVEINDSISEDDVMHLYVNDRKKVDFENYQNVICFDKPVYDIDELVITQDNTLVYIAEGTVVNGRIDACNVKHLKICGAGILTMEKYLRRGSFATCMHVSNCSDVVIEDICIMDSCNWSLHLNGCEDVKICNVKIIGSRGNADGIDVCGSRNVHVERCFIRTYDDCLVVKAFDTGNVENVLFEKCVLWNDMSRPMEVGVEIRCDELKNVIFRDMDVIHNLTCYPIFGIHHGDRAKISDIHFENIRIEHAPGAQLFDFRITDSVWNKDANKGNIRDIYIDDIFLVGKEGKDFQKLHARIDGFSETSDIRNIHIGNVNAFGKKIQNGTQLGLELLGHVDEVFFEENVFQSKACTEVVQNDTEQGCLVSDVQVQKEFCLQEDGRYHGTVKLEITNHMSEPVCGKCGIRIFPKNNAAVNEECSEYSLKVGESLERVYEINAEAGKVLIESVTDNILFRPCVRYIPLPYVLKEKAENAPVVRFDNYFGDVYGTARFTLRNGFLTMYSDLLKEYEMTMYAALPAEVRDNEVLFAAEESYFGEGPVVKMKNGRQVTAPEIGNHFEITHVFKNQPNVEIRKVPLERRFDGSIKVPLTSFGFDKGTKEFLLEILVHKQTSYDKPITLFRSTLPEETAHMYGKFIVEE